MFANELIKACCCLRRPSKYNFPLNTTENLISLDSGHIGRKITAILNDKKFGKKFLLRSRSCCAEKWKENLWFRWCIVESSVIAIKELLRGKTNEIEIFDPSFLGSIPCFHYRILENPPVEYFVVSI